MAIIIQKREGCNNSESSFIYGDRTIYAASGIHLVSDENATREKYPSVSFRKMIGLLSLVSAPPSKLAGCLLGNLEFLPGPSLRRGLISLALEYHDTPWKIHKLWSRKSDTALKVSLKRTCMRSFAKRSTWNREAGAANVHIGRKPAFISFCVLLRC